MPHPEAPPTPLQRATRALSRLQTEHPLLLFLAFGLALFAADAALGPDGRAARPDDERVIVVGGEYAGKLLERVPDAARHPPTTAELREALGGWIDEEALYREARRYGLEHGDVIVRRRLVQKMRALLEQLHPVPEPSDAELAARLAADPERYGHAARVGFEQVFLSRAQRGEALQRDARRLLAQLRAGHEGADALGDAAPTGNEMASATADALARRYGRRFADAVLALPAGDWHGPVPSSLGLHLVRVRAHTPFRPGTLDEAREKLRRDHRVAQRAALDRAAIDALLARSAIEVRVPEDPE